MATQAVAGTGVRVPPVEDERWRRGLAEVLRRPASLQLHAQPIVDLQTGRIAGYELLSRFPVDVVAAPPDLWFAAAERWNVNAQLQSRVLAAGFAVREALPAGAFVTVNVEPHLLTRPLVRGALLGHRDLSGVIVELTEHTPADDARALASAVAALRERGALIAMDDAGAGYAGLSQLLALRPDVVKLDRELISGIDTDPAKRALVEVVGDLVGRMDGWILAEGIETDDELETVIGLGVPLGQGFGLARPAPGLLPLLPAELLERIRHASGRTRLTENVVSLLRPARVATASADPIDRVDRDGFDVVLGRDGRPAAVRWGGPDAGAGGERWSPALTVAPSTSPREVALRAATRAGADVGAPLVCTDAAGRVLGLVHVGDLLVALAASSRDPAAPTGNEGLAH